MEPIVTQRKNQHQQQTRNPGSVGGHLQLGNDRRP